MFSAIASIISTPGRDDPRQVRGVRGIARLVVSFKDDHVAFHGRSLRKPACFRMLDSVFGFKVALGGVTVVGGYDGAHD